MTHFTAPCQHIFIEFRSDIGFACAKTELKERDQEARTLEACTSHSDTFEKGAINCALHVSRPTSTIASHNFSQQLKSISLPAEETGGVP